MRTVLVLGASGFIGARIAMAAAGAGWNVRAGARSPAEAAKRAPQLGWVRAEFAELRRPDAWRPLLEGVDAVVNCVGVLQDAAGETSRIAHVEGPKALIEACERAGVRRLVHVSAVGLGSSAAYARDKETTETLLAASSLDWFVVRPSLVVAREVYGGTALIRGLAGLPGLIPVAFAAARFRPLANEDLAHLIVRLLAEPLPAGRIIEAAGPQTITLEQLIVAYRAWLGFPPAIIMRVPDGLARFITVFGDAVAWLGWKPAMRSTSLSQLAYDTAGQGPPTPGARSFTEVLVANPSSVQDRWHARLYFARPLAILVLGLFWLLSGMITLGPGAQAAAAILIRAGLGQWAGHVAIAGAWLDIALGLALWVRPWTRLASFAMVAVSLGYIAVGTARLPELWVDPLGPLVKVLPVMVLCLVVAATDDRR